MELPSSKVLTHTRAVLLLAPVVGGAKEEEAAQKWNNWIFFFFFFVYLQLSPEKALLCSKPFKINITTAL